MKIYTKSGDKGTTTDILGQIVSKGDVNFLEQIPDEAMKMRD